MKSAGKTTVFFASIFLLSLLLFTISVLSESSMQIMDKYICRIIRYALSSVTSIVRFSVFEIFLLLSPLLIFVLINYTIHGVNDYKVRFCSVLSFISIFASLYIFTVGIAYKTPSPFSKYDGSVSSDELISAAFVLRERVNIESEFILSEPSFEEISDKTVKTFAKVCSKHGVEEVNLPRPKPLLTSKLFSYTGALAIYSFPTGEVNININAPRYTIPFTVLHELCHSCGLSAEADANFAAYLISCDSDCHYVRYSAALSVLEYILADLKKTDFEAYLSCYNGLSQRALDDISEWKEYSQKYHRQFVFDVFDRANKAHLKRWDRNAGASYGKVAVYVTNYLNSA